MEVNISDLSTVISFSDYYEGAAPALLLNHTPWVTISYRQRSEVDTYTPMMFQILFKWVLARHSATRKGPYCSLSRVCSSVLKLLLHESF